MSQMEKLKPENDIPVVIVNEEGAIAHVNGCFEATYGWKSEELLGRTLTILIPDALRDAHNMGFSRFLVTNKPTLLNQPLELKILRGDGTEQSAVHLITAEKSAGRWLFRASITPR
jgi:PAS domain S-box-containing protein